MATNQTSNITSAFIDLATYDALEQFMYGGQKAISYFVRFHTKATWFSHIPTKLSNTGTAAFGSTSWSSSVSRAGDYLLYSWLRLTIPAVAISAEKANYSFEADKIANSNTLFPINNSAKELDPWNRPDVTKGAYRIRWTRNFMHNLIKEALLNFNDITAARLDNYFLDFWAAYTTPAGKQAGYDAMIGNIDALINPMQAPMPIIEQKLYGQTTTSLPPAPGMVLPSVTLNLPLPFFYARDTGVALPTAALPYNDMKIQFNFRSLTDLLVVDDLTTGKSRPFTAGDMDPNYTNAQLQQVEVWCDYAIVSNYERKQMGLKPRDILIEQVQTASVNGFNSNSASGISNFDIRFSHAIKALFFGLQNGTNSSEWSNYSAASPVAYWDYGKRQGGVDFTPAFAADPLSSTAIKYENSVRQDLSSDYYSQIMPYYHAVSIPTGNKVGYHMFSYALDLASVDPIGSTNFSKLTNVSFQFQLSKQAVKSTSGDTSNALHIQNQIPLDFKQSVFSNALPTAGTTMVLGNGVGGILPSMAAGYGSPQVFNVIIIGLNHNVVRISGGALGFPVL
jgi:hypothetical protein